MQLCEVGEIHYLSWKRKFECCKDENGREELLTDINETCTRMENELNQWKKTIRDKRNVCYYLNHFTMKQVLNLRKELANACTGQVAVDELPLQTFMMLENVNKRIDALLLADVLRTLVPDNQIFLTKGFKNDQNDTKSKSNRRRVNSIDNFISAKEALEGIPMDINTDDHLLAALQDCGRRATKDELVAWVVSHESDDEETIIMSCEEAKKNPQFSDLLKEVFGPEYQSVVEEEFSSDGTATCRR